MKKLIVFTDLDGTLLDHHNYSWQPASAAIKKLQILNYPLILNSSKTFVEMQVLAEEMQIRHPIISENGSVAAMNIDCEDDDNSILNAYRLHYFAQPYSNIIKLLTELRENECYRFSGFNDMTIAEVMQSTGLSEDAAMAAMKREATEPLLWNDTEERLEEFTSRLEQNGLSVTRGGRFYHVMSPVDKAQALNWLLECYKVREPHTEWLTMALGDSANDISMLETVDIPVLISNPKSVQPDVSHIKDIIITSETGPAGWNKAVLDTLENKIEE